jgi:5-hydroxyisourate hydrolase-like protein (transthyretin family)
MLDAVTAEDIRAVVAKLIEQAKAGDLAAIREVLDRTLGKPLAGVAVALQMAADNSGPRAETVVHVVDDDGWYGNDAHAKATGLRRKMLEEPDYLEYLRERAAT